MDQVHETTVTTDPDVAPIPFDSRSFNPRLWEGLPSQTNRYDDTNAGPRRERKIEVGSILDGEDLGDEAAIKIGSVPAGWQEYHHPVEGRAYFYNRELRLVTEMYIRHQGVLEQVMMWHIQLTELRGHVLPAAAEFDVFLDCSSGTTCRYYLIDHGNKTVCWLRSRRTADLAITDVRSILHLQALLREEYWTHAEYMPKDENHLAAARAELQGALAGSMLDHMTSEGSTSPFTTFECKAYLLALEKAAESGHMIYMNWSIARIMGLLVHSRNVNVYGQYGARLDRTATVEGRRHPVRSHSYLRTSNLFGGGPVIHLNRLENLWVDRIIYTHHWRALLKDLTEEWTSAAVAAAVMWASNLVFVASNGVDIVTKTICGVSGVLAGASGVYALYLIREHRALGKYAAHAANYFQLYEKHNTGLQDLSIQYSAPWAGIMWSFGLTCAGIAFLLVSSLIALAGASLHVAVTAVLVAGVYIHARGIDPTISDMRRMLARLGFPQFVPSTPIARAMSDSNTGQFEEPPPYELEVTQHDSRLRPR